MKVQHFDVGAQEADAAVAPAAYFGMGDATPAHDRLTMRPLTL
jgi:hypothetical protein